MSVAYLDTSALVKRYADEVGSVWLRALVDPGLQPLIIVSHLLIAEMTSAFSRRVREGALSPEDYARLTSAFRADCLNEYHIYPIDGGVIDAASRLIERHALHTLDAVHLATGLAVGRFLIEHDIPTVTFVSADTRLLAAASAEGMAVENPNAHP